jgi:hypothetical protein
MQSLLLLTHSVFRYFILVFLILLIARSFVGWWYKRPYNPLDERLGFWLFMVTHTQLILGLILYFTSGVVVFSSSSMKDAVARYWLVEHISMMLIAIVLITLARTTSKKLADSTAKYKRLFIFNGLALVLILIAILQSGRGFFSLPEY